MALSWSAARIEGLRHLPWPKVGGKPVDVTDPQGLHVVGDDGEWRHVLKHHKEFAQTGMLDALCSTVEDPDFITDDRDPGKKQAYYRPAPFPYKDPLLVKVVVTLGRSGGRLKTAHIAAGVSPNEGVLWTKPKPPKVVVKGKK